MANVLAVGIDLGCDTLKLSYAYERGKSKSVIYGKIEKKESVRHVAIPAVAYYDGTGWIFGSDVEKGEEKPFINVVKIKNLLSLLYPVTKDGRVVLKDGKETYPTKRHFYEGEYFPKFFFPLKQKNLNNFAKVIADDRAFTAKGYTPQKVCKLFFAYVREIVNTGIAEIEKKTKQQFDEVRLSIVHPAQVGSLYVEELTAEVKTAFGKKPSKVMNSGRALSMFAMERGAVRSDDEILIFDMGEDTLSVLKCFINDDGHVVVEPAADHSMPIDIGGNDVDFSIAEYIERDILQRETVGSPSFGEEGHIYEEGLQAKQYLFLKEIKKAKLLLSIPSLDEVFAGGVPVSLHRDLYLQLRLTKRQLMESVGITSDSGIAKRILNYVTEELSREVNGEVKKIFLTGGLVETCGLVKYIKQGVKAVKPDVAVRTFDDDIDNGDGMIIQTYEDSVYAPSVGAAIVALKDLNVSAGLTNSYGTWMSVNGTKILVILVGRGHIFDESKSEKLSASCNLQGTLPEEFFSVRLSKSSVAKRKYEGELSYITSRGETYLCIGEPGSAQRKRVEKLFQLKNITGPNAKISCTYRGRTIAICEPRLVVEEGVQSQPYSTVMTPFVEKTGNGQRRINVTFEDRGIATVKESEINIALVGVSRIVGEAN
ncbi:MAG: hypothetical protein K2O67_02370 [Clostridia bacterium]|nr:hypothetical protein [Clostridia bacterium]